MRVIYPNARYIGARYNGARLYIHLPYCLLFPLLTLD